MKTDELLKLLPTLNKEQAKIITAWAARFNIDKKADDENTKLILEIINKELGTRAPFGAVKNPWIVNASNMAHFIDTTFPGVKKVVRIALFKMCIGFVIENLTYMKVPVTFTTVWVNLPRVPVLFEEQFPGYKKSGLTGVILKAMGA